MRERGPPVPGTPHSAHSAICKDVPATAAHASRHSKNHGTQVQLFLSLQLSQALLKYAQVK